MSSHLKVNFIDRYENFDSAIKDRILLSPKQSNTKGRR